MLMNEHDDRFCRRYISGDVSGNDYVNGGGGGAIT